MSKQKISVVVTGRNYDYSGNLHQRMIPSLNSFLKYYDEVIYVDFNSIDGSYFDKIKSNIDKTNKLKVINVSPEQCIGLSKDFDNKFIEVVARNIGIRRASGDFILSSNPDIICSRPSDDQLNNNTMFAGARRDVPIEFYTSMDHGILEEKLMSLMNLFIKKPRVLDEYGNPIWDPNDRWSVVVCCGDYQLAHRNVWYAIKGFEESATGRCYADSNLMKKASLTGFDIKEITLPIFHLNHNTEKYIKNDKETPKNCQIAYVQNFIKTTNSDDWGYSDIIFDEIIF
jgi:glycosyltransferase involved in cell wall biosynthesis